MIDQWRSYFDMPAPWSNNHNHAPSLFINSNKELSLTQLVGGVGVHTHQPGLIPSNSNLGAYFFLYAMPSSSSWLVEFTLFDLMRLLSLNSSHGKN